MGKKSCEAGKRPSLSLAWQSCRSDVKYKILYDVKGPTPTQAFLASKRSDAVIVLQSKFCYGSVATCLFDFILIVCFVLVQHASIIYSDFSVPCCVNLANNNKGILPPWYINRTSSLSSDHDILPYCMLNKIRYLCIKDTLNQIIF